MCTRTVEEEGPELGSAEGWEGLEAEDAIREAGSGPFVSLSGRKVFQKATTHERRAGGKISCKSWKGAEPSRQMCCEITCPSHLYQIQCSSGIIKLITNGATVHFRTTAQVK